MRSHARDKDTTRTKDTKASYVEIRSLPRLNGVQHEVAEKDVKDRRAQ
jgi:hypothetical protein